MNDAVRVPTDGLLTTAELAARADFTLGLAAVSPSSRTIAGPGGTADVEPRVMQVLVVLADAGGQVVTRGTLFDRCWGGVYVGDDSLNRAIGAIRKLAADIAGGSFEVETIPRTGYRLTGAGAAALVSAAEPATTAGLSRRQLGAGVFGLVALGALGTWVEYNSRKDREFDALMARGERAMRRGIWDSETAAIFKQAISIRPGNARAWGLLALVSTGVAQGVGAQNAAAVVEEAETAAQKALAIDAKEPNALLAIFELQGSTLDWSTRDRRLRQIIAIDPKNTIAIAALVLLLQAAGLNRESRDWNERAIALEPLSVDFLSKRALKLWIAGRVSEADKVIDQVRGLYPADPGPWWVRFAILALTGRPRAARAMLDGDPKRFDSPAEASIWHAALDALDQRSSASISTARAACIDGASKGPWLAGEGVMILSALGDVDTAFDICNGFLLSRGSIVRKDKPASNEVVNDAVSRINTQWLFTPPCRIMRSDARFLALCEGIGLGDYWRARGLEPDYLRIERPNRR